MLERTGLVAATAVMLALLAVAGPAFGMVRVDPEAQGLTPSRPVATQPTQGDLIRAAALDRKYGNAWTRLSSGEFVALVKMFGNDVTTKYTPQELRDIVDRGNTGNAASDGFDWGDAGIGTLGAIGIVLGACAGIVLIVRSRRSHPALGRAHSAV